METGDDKYLDVVVVGAGVVGLACARALQRSGLDVCVVDPESPGSVCSFGNAGVIATDHVLPMARPEVLRRLPALLGNPRGPLYLKASRIPALLPWMLRFAAASRPARVERGIRAIAALTGRSLPAWEAELTASGGLHLLRRQGMHSVYRSEAAFRRDAGERASQQGAGVPFEVLSAAALRDREPALTDGLVRGVFYPEVAHVIDPQAVVQCLADALVRDGGTLLRGEVTRLEETPHRVTVALSRGWLPCRHAVLAAGLASRRLCRSLGVDPPLAAEMGYHLRFPGAEERLRAPVAVAEHGFLVTPMHGHLRAAGTVELARREMPAAWSRADVLRFRATDLFRDPLPEPAEPWRGSRPTLPDFLPAIGLLPGYRRVVAAFGHQHIGLTTAAVTGTLVRDVVRGTQPALDIAPYDPGRFTSLGHERKWRP